MAKSRNFKYLFSAHLISNIGDGVAALAYPWLATLISRDPVDVAFVVFAGRLPWFLLALPAGVITDRMPHKWLMVAADWFRFLVTLGVVAIVFFGPEMNGDGNRALILALGGLVFLLGSAEVLHDNTAQTILPTLVSQAHLPRANGLLGSAEQVVGQFIGPPLAGFLIALALPLPFALDAVSFAVAALLLTYLKPRSFQRPEPQPAWAAVRAGLVWLFKRPILLRLAILTGLMNLGATIYLTILVLFAQEILGLGAAGYGLLLTAGAAGGALGGVLAPEVIARIGAGWGLRIGAVLIALESALIGLANGPALVAASLFGGMFGSMMWNVVAVPLRQRIVPPDLLRRVNSVYRFISWGMIPIGALLAGFIVRLAERFVDHEAALRSPFLLVGAGLAVLALYVFARFSNQSVERESAVPG